MCDESSSVQHVQLKVILQNPDFRQRCRGLFASTKRSLWTFLRLSLQTVPKSFSATWCVGVRCTNCAFLFWTRLLRLRPFRKAEETLFHKFGLKPRVIPFDNQAVGIGGQAKVLGKVEMPSGMGGVNGKVKYTVVDSPGVPPLTPVSLLKQVGAVIDLNCNTMDLKKIETTTTLRTLPS